MLNADIGAPYKGQEKQTLDLAQERERDLILKLIGYSERYEPIFFSISPHLRSVIHNVSHIFMTGQRLKVTE